MLCLPALLAFPAAAERRAVQGPGRSPARDRPRRPGARARRRATRPPTGTLIPVTLASSYTGDPAVAQTYATFLGTLPHGPELASLKVTVVPSSEIASACGGRAERRHPRLLRRRRPDDDRPRRPGRRAATISVNYVIAHEYGHHIAAHRSNAPLRALDFGPKRWSSYELVCTNTHGRQARARRPGRQLPLQPGRGVGGGLRAAGLPDRGLALHAAAASRRRARRWRRRPTSRSPGPSASATTFTGTNTRTFKLPITLDGAFTLQLDGPAQGQLRPRRALGRQGRRPHDPQGLQATASTTGSPAATAGPRPCGSRWSGDRASGPYTLTAKYAG